MALERKTAAGTVTVAGAPTYPEPPAGAYLVFATDDQLVADAHPEYAWIVLEAP